MDIASLGLSIDSGPVERAVSALNRLPPAAQNAASGVDRLNTASRTLSAGADSVAGAAEREARALTQSTSAMNDNARAAQVAGSARRAITQQMVNSFASVRDDFGGVGRAADIAAYGQAMDDLRAKFNPLFAAGRQYRATLDEIGQAAKVGAISERERADAIQRTKDAFAAHVRTLGAVDKANAKMASGVGLARHELINLSRQVQDVGVSLVSGGSPFMVLAQQGPQIADIFSSSQGSVRGFLGQVRGLISPVTLLAGGTVALGAAAYGAWRFWKDFALTLDDTARAMGVTSSEAAKLQAAASFRGIGGVDFAAGMKGFSAEVYRAESGAGSLAELLRANGQTVRGTADAMERVATLIENARSDQQRLQLLQQAGLPATMEWVRLLSGGAEGLRRAKEEAAAFGGAANDEMIQKAREFDEAWTRAWTNFGLGARSAIVSAVDTIQNLDNSLGALLRRMVFGAPTATGALQGALAARRAGIEAGSIFTANTPVDQFYGGTGALGRGKRTTDPQEQQRALALESQRLGILSQLGSVADQVRQKEIEIAQARASGVRITEAEEAALLRLSKAQALGTLQMQQQTGQLRIEADTFGMSAGAAAAYRAEQERLLELRLRGQAPTEEEIRLLRENARALGEATQRISDQRQIGQIGAEFATGFVRDLRNGVSAAEALGNALDRLADRLIDMALQNLVLKALGGLGPGGASFLAGLLPSANGNVFAGGNVIPFARGGVVTRPTIFPMANGAGLMGEAGPEAVMPLRRTPDGRLGVAASGSGVGTTVIINNNAAGATVSQRTDQNGATVIDVESAVDGMMAGRVARGRGATAKAAGLQPRLRG